MDRLYLNLVNGLQMPFDDTFVGGRPMLPESVPLPQCELCRSELSFFWQVAFSEPHGWVGWTLAMFACTNCDMPEHGAPKMINPPLKDAILTESFLEDYQDNFRLIVFETNARTIRLDYEPRVMFRRLWIESAPSASCIGHLGGDPIWVTEDETPVALTSGEPMCFLLQIYHEAQYPIEATAPRQTESNIMTKSIGPSPNPYYELFLRNALYFFGAVNPGAAPVYVFIQAD